MQRSQSTRSALRLLHFRVCVNADQTFVILVNELLVARIEEGLQRLLRRCKCGLVEWICSGEVRVDGTTTAPGVPTVAEWIKTLAYLGTPYNQFPSTPSVSRYKT